MNVLLCSPYNINSKVVQSGIAIWAQNIVSYYNGLNSDINLRIVAYDRKTDAKGGIFKRAWNAFIEYRRPILETKKQLDEGQYDVIHLCTSASISFLKDILVLWIAKRRGVKTIVHFHFGRISELVQQRNWEWKLLLRILRMTDAAVTMDMKSYNSLHNYGFNNVHYLPNPLSLSIMQQVNKESVTTKKEKRKLCFVGHVIPSKGVYEMVEACQGINDIKLIVLGKVEEGVHDKMKQIAHNGNWLIFKGEVDHKKVISELLSTSIFILPSYTEGFPNVILESMACGCAIATTAVGAIPEMLDIESKEPCGLCCAPKDIDGLRQNIQYYLDHTDEARRYAERAIRRVNEMYIVQEVWGQLESIWRSSTRVDVV